MEQKKKLRKVLRAGFTRAANELEPLFSREVDVYQQIRVCWEILQSKYEEVRVVDKGIFDILIEQDASEEDLQVEVDSCDVYCRKYTQLKIQYDDYCVQGVERSNEVKLAEAGSEYRSISSINVASGTGRRKFKLPNIEFKKFGGDIRDWLPFWGQFRKVHEDSSIDLSDKIGYLFQATIPGSRARRLVESFPAVHDNYVKIIEALNSRFGREDLQIEVYIRELLKLILNNAAARNKWDISLLYDNIETQLRALETLGVTSDNCAAMLFPLIESCLPEDLLRVWQRSLEFSTSRKGQSISGLQETEEVPLKNRLESLMQFLKNEVENEQRIALASEGFGLGASMSQTADKDKRVRAKVASPNIPTATGLINYEAAKCVFCDGAHDSNGCFKAQKFSLQQKMTILTEKKACFRCLKVGHQSRRCRMRLHCVICGRLHVVLICPELPAHKKDQEKEPGEQLGKANQALANQTSNHVVLQTLLVKIEGKSRTTEVRALIDSGSQRSYVLKSTVQRLGCVPEREEMIVHCLFGGSSTTQQRHNCYNLKIRKDDYVCFLEALDQTTICNEIPPVFRGPWEEELSRLNVPIEDIYQSGPIELLIGADVAGKLYTGRRHVLQCGLVAIETLLGWTLMGKIPFDTPNVNTAMTVFSLFVKDASIADLWELDVLGIREPTMEKTRQEMALAAKEFFMQNIMMNCEGRYEVKLPWIEGHPPLPENYVVASSRLDVVLKRLKNERLLEDYDNIFQEWAQEGIIEEVELLNSDGRAHYLPHRPVIKESSATTKIRPVFDASARVKNQPSLNQCLEKGLNLIELIPSILLRFRKRKIGVVSDIRKAFLQIGVHVSDRDFLRFLWINSNGNEKIFRHRRVVFGVSSSPFLLGATIEYHLSESLKKGSAPNALYTEETIHKLASSFYMDDCVTSVDNEDELKRFIRESSILMAEAKFDLRGWEFTQDTEADLPNLSVLGLNWNPRKDTLSISERYLKDITDLPNETITKRLILSVAQRIFDPIGFTYPAMLKPKLLLQKIWKKELNWDTPVGDDIRKEFCEWVKELSELRLIELPRWINGRSEETHSLHIFCDASQDAYSAVVFLRSVSQGKVRVHLLAVKARVAPLKKLTIPRLELLATTIGARLYSSVRGNFEQEINCFFRSDSSTVLSWIRRTEEWGTFVGNRVREIRRLTAIELWRHVPGSCNPADLPSCGCSPRRLFESRWWEGPECLYNDEILWPQKNLEYDEEEISQERKKRLITIIFNWSENGWRLNYFSKYFKTIRSVAWIFRFVHNARNPMQRLRGR